MRDDSIRTLQHLVEKLDASVRLGEVHAITGHVKTALCDLIRAHELEIPERLRRPHPERYARRLLHRDGVLGYTAVVMTWAPGQTTCLHDHSGIWCVEGVVAGEMSVTRYDLVESAGDRMRFTLVEQVRAGVGSSGALIPPYEYHVLGNALPDQVSVTLHIYGGEMDRCNIYEPAGDGTWTRIEKSLAYDE